jgi:hypothetical protein
LVVEEDESEETADECDEPVSKRSFSSKRASASGDVRAAGADGRPGAEGGGAAGGVLG